MTPLPSHRAIPAVHGSHQRGSVFVIALVLLAILTVLGITGAKNTALEESMVGNTRDRQLAFQAAEAALLAGERLLANGHPPFTDSCEEGFCTQGCPSQPRWNDPALNLWNTPSRHRSHALAPSGVRTPPAFIIEDLCEFGSQTWRDANPGWTDLPQRLYRVTALGSGGTDQAKVMLQSTYAVTRMVDPACALCDPDSLNTTTSTSTSTTTSTIGSTTTSSVASTSSTTTSTPVTTTSTPVTTTSTPVTTTSAPVTTTSTTTSAPVTTTSTTTSAPVTTTSTTTSTTTTSVPASTTTTSVYDCRCKKHSSGTGRKTNNQPACCTNSVCNNNRPANFSSMATDAIYWTTCE
ncbi:MAG: hypothetical protein HQL99_06065 [Magnetococcales bacterium]|nr:hypothetical protein [Magnetococcales bacterium]